MSDTSFVDNATIESIEELSPLLRRVRMRPDRIPEPGEDWFEAGQHVTVAFEVDGDGSRWLKRPYSIASEPEERRFLEFLLRRSSRSDAQDLFIHRLWAKRPGTRLHVGEKIGGAFTLSRTIGADDDRNVVLVAAGTGVAPFASMVRSLGRQSSGRLNRTTLLHGARRAEELAYREEFSALLEKRYVPTVSRPDESPEWEGERGRVEELLERDRFATLEPGTSVVFVCGYRETIAGTLTRLASRGFVPDEPKARKALGLPDDAPPSVFFEYYGSRPLLDPA